MNELDLLLDVAGRLGRLRIPYFVNGSMAGNYYGRPRATFDVDLVIELEQERIGDLISVLERDFYVDKDAVEDAVTRRTEFNAIHLATSMKVDFWLAKRNEFNRERMRRRRRRKIGRRSIWLTSPEDLILVKLDWHKKGGSERQLSDAAGVLQVSGRGLNMEYLTKWAGKLRLKKGLKLILSKSDEL